MSVTITPFNARAATKAAEAAADRRHSQLQDELEEEFDEAVALAAEYADHLATGGDPTWYPQPDRRDVASRGLARIAREAVFDAWNESRERRSVTYPWGRNMPWAWLMQEALLEQLGTPIRSSDLSRVGRNQSPQAIAEAAWAIQVATAGAIRVRKTKVDGKVAWVARLPVEGDELADIGWREGVHSGTSLTEEVVAAALERPFKGHVHDYPAE